MRLFVSAFLIIASFVLPAAAQAAVFTGVFSGANEAPPNASPGSGSIVVTIDEGAHTMRIEISFADLLATTTAAHLHCCTAPGSNAAVATQTPTFSGFPSGVTSGSYDNTFDLTLSSTYSSGFITDHGGTAASAEAALTAALFDGLVYANIHTTQFPGGEIRANLSAVPLPAALWLFAAGLLPMANAWRRRQTALA